jgi:RNA polymerase sigma-32 factor
MGSVKTANLTDDRGFMRYASTVSSVEYLSAERERHLLAEVALGNEKARTRLVEAHLRLVISMAVKFLGYGHPLSELVAVGNVGLLEGASRFDAGKENRFATYVSWWIGAALKEYVLKNASSVKTPTTKEMKSLFFKGAAYRRSLEAKGLSDTAISDAMSVRFGIPANEIAEIMTLQRPMTSLSAPVGDNEDGSISIGDAIADDAPLQDEVVLQAREHETNVGRLRDILSTMGEREQDIFRARRLRDEPMTLEELANRHSVSRERIRQIEVKVFEKVRKAMLMAA